LPHGRTLKVINAFDAVVMLDECARNQTSCACCDADHKLNFKANFITDSCSNGFSDRRVALNFFQLIRSSKLSGARGSTTTFILLTKDKKFIGAVDREQLANAGRRRRPLKVDHKSKKIERDGVVINICVMKKTGCPIKRLNEFMATIGS